MKKINLFNDTKHSVWYFAIIEAAQKSCRVRLGKSDPKYVYYESHHVIPKSLGGSDQRHNRVFLTAREHLICHVLLTKMCIEPDHANRMRFALRMMMRVKNDHQYSRSYATRMVEQYRAVRPEMPLASIEASRSKNIGRKHSAETKDKMRLAAVGRIKSAETKAKMSAAKQQMSDATKDLIGSAKRGKPLSDEHRQKIREAGLRRAQSKLFSTS